MPVLGWKSPNLRQKELYARRNYLMQFGAGPFSASDNSTSLLSFLQSHIINKRTDFNELVC